MAGKFFLFCAQFLLLQIINTQCLPRLGTPPLAASLASPLATVPLNTGLAYDCGVASSGGSFPVTSASPIPPTGVSIVSENAIEGALVVEGNLPLLGSVGVEGAFPTCGAGAVSYGCGNGAVLIDAEVPIATGMLAPSIGSNIGRVANPFGPSVGALGAGRLGNRGCSRGLY